MTNTFNFAEKEINILIETSIDPENRPLIEPFKDEILALCEKFGQSGQSGGSALLTAIAISKTIKRLLAQNPICPITGAKSEWVNVAEYGEPGERNCVWQNNRCYALFKNSENRAYYLDAIIWKDNEGYTYSGGAFLNEEKMLSRQFIKSFPFIPKTFYIDVVEINGERHVKSPSQLDKVFRYYEKYK